MRQERKVVTVLFCDLVSFTSQSEEMDPEDVAAMLGPYHARVKEELERHGGTVEKFIGDAVMALFGAPVAHEDDPERAVRAAFAIRDFAVEEEIELRIGVTTGEALVNLDASPEAGETMATGDVVNTAARLQSAAPVNGVLVSEKTYLATRHAIDYREAEPVEAKGKAKPVPVWEAASAAPLQDRAHTTPLVGRGEELEQLGRVLARVIEERAPKLVTVIGEPGVGKSRLVHELSRENGAVVWLTGRCLPYGDGVSFWALREIVKTQLGVLESDSPERAEEKLVAAVEDPWVAGHLRTLVGTGEDREGLGDDRAETFAAWRRFLTTLAEERPMALVLEDVQWADDGLLDFMSHLVEWALESPLLVLCTARPELLERRPGWGTAVPLAPLSDDETGRLLTTLTEADASSDLVARAGGNPLYAEQYARLIVEGGSPEDLPMTVQGIIAARLDGLPADEKSLLQDAAVVGEISWSGAVAAAGGSDRWTVEERLLALERRDLVRRRRASSVEGQSEYAFAHVLVRDVAYGEMPRAERAQKHLRVAQWIESLSRAEDHAEVLAHHYLETLTLTKALGGDVSEFAGRAHAALCEAGDRASAIHSYATAARLYDAALDLPGVGPLDRPGLLLDAGRAHWMATEGGAELFQQASAEFQAHDDPERAAEAERYLAEIARSRGDGDRAAAHLDEALALVRARPPSPSIGRVLGYAARHYMVIGENEDAVRHGREALSIADAFALDDVRVEALDAIGAARMQMGDRGGQADLERSIEIGLEHNSIETVRSFNNLGAGLVMLADLREVARVWDRGREVAREFGGSGVGRLIGLNLINQSYWSGDWDTAVQLSEALIDEHETSAPQRFAVWAYDVRARMRSARDDLDGALEDSIDSLATARGTSEPSIVASALAFGAVAALTSGRVTEASALADELLALHPARRPLARFAILFDLAVALQELGRPEAMLAETAQSEVRTRWVEAAEAQSEGEFERAAEVYAEAGALPLEAYARLRAGEKLLGKGRRSEGEEQLDQAVVFWRSVGATRYVREAESLLGASA